MDLTYTCPGYFLFNTSTCLSPTQSHLRVSSPHSRSSQQRTNTRTAQAQSFHEPTLPSPPGESRTTTSPMVNRPEGARAQPIAVSLPAWEPDWHNTVANGGCPTVCCSFVFACIYAGSDGCGEQALLRRSSLPHQVFSLSLSWTRPRSYRAAGASGHRGGL